MLHEKDIFIISKSIQDDKFLVFLQPKKILIFKKEDNIKAFFNKLQTEIEAGNWLAGYSSYEAGFYFEDCFKRHKKTDIPLIWFGVFSNPLVVKNIEDLWEIEEIKNFSNLKFSYLYKNLKINQSKSNYVKIMKKIHEAITSGTFYQINYSLNLKSDFIGNAFLLFLDLLKEQNTLYSSFINANDFQILSLSPELFFDKTESILTTKPMKGTIKRGKNPETDRQNKDILKNCEKNMAENVMIVDLLRNDMGKISNFNSVSVTNLFEIEEHKTVFQMTSTIKSKLKPNTNLYDIFRALFPSGSITGAPKIKAMEIINKLEKHQRNIFCGSIGYISPDYNARFNVAIRTLLINKNKLELNVGSGIVYDSIAEEEYKECLLKAKFFTDIDFEIIETLKWENDKKSYFLFNKHFDRLTKSAKKLDFKVNVNEIINDLNEKSLKFNENMKLRILLKRNGDFSVEAEAINFIDFKSLPTISFSDIVINSKDIFLKHKTTKRHIYDLELKRAKKNGFYDFIFKNEKDEITEGCYNNIIIEINKKYFTPPVSCGLLPGVYRDYLINNSKLKVYEKKLYTSDLINADKIYMINSVRDFVEVKLQNK